MERHRTLDSSMSSLYSGSNVSQTPSRQLEPTSGGNYHHHYPPSSTAPSPTPSGQGGGGGGNAQLMAQISQNDSIGSGTSSQGLRATTIGTVVVRCGPIQLVIALLQSTEKLYIKVVELEPKITTLGANLDESIRLQTDHDETLRNVQNLPGPMEEFVHKADKLLASKRISSDLVNAMADTLNIIWADILHLLQDRQNILHMCTQFHDKMTQCQRRMDSLEVACIDTMIPIEVAAVQEFLSKFKQLRIDMLTAVMAALKDGNELLAQLQELENLETLDTRPEHIKRDAARAVHQVQQWLEALHDRRNTLEIAWQTRKTQLEQCLALAMLGRELIEVEALLQRQKDEISNLFSLGECEHTANLALGNYREWKQQAVQIRDRALKITRAKEKLQASGTFTGDEACARAYNVLSACSEHLDLVDQREHWLQQSREFFTKADNTLKVLEKLEVELSNVKLPPNSPESYAMYAKVAKDVARFTEEPLRLGYSILDEVGRTQPETQGIKRVLDEIENRKAYIDSICSDSSEEQRRVNDALKEFLAQHNDLLQWLMASGQQYLQQNIHMGKTLDQSKQFLLQHHELMQDLEIKGELINLLLESIKTHLESLSPQQRYDVDSKAESLHKHWIELKDLVLKRVDCVSVLIEFFEKANEFGSQMDNLKRQLALTPNAQKLPFLQETWTSMRSNFSELKDLGQRFKSWKILDPYLDTKPSVNAVEDILNGFSKQQIDVTTSFENWTTHITEKREVETILETIMSQNEETAAKTSNVDTQLYPIFTTPSEDAKHLHTITGEKLKVVLQDIDQAQNEIQERVHTTLNIQTKDPEAMQKIEQVISNLRTLKSKLDGIKYDYKTLVESSMHFLESVMKIHQEITEHFNKQKHNQQNSNEAIERCIAEHEKFRDVSMERFRSLITQSEILIDRVRALEPAGAKEVDTDRILKLMENLRIYFESCNGERMNSLERLEKLDKFKNDLQDINRSLDSVSRQLHEINGQNVDSLAAAKTTSLAFEYFERTIELLEKRIEKFTETTTEQLLISNPESEAYFREELRKLNEKWQQFRDQVKQKRNSLNQATEFFEVVEKIDCEYREISYFYNSVSNKIPYLRDPVEASNLVNDIEKYVNEREAPLRVKLENAAKCTHDMNKVSQLYNDVMTIFQSFMKLKSDITIVAERLKNEERSREQREREAREQAEREKAIREAEARERAAREQEARLQAFREQAEREQMERDRLARELAAREQAVREEEQRLMLAREQTAHEQAMREQKAREEEQARLKALREEEARLQMVREQTAREQAMREQQAREEEQTRLRIIREEEIRLQTLREKTVREEEARIQSLREQTKREEESRMLALKEQMQREESLKRLQNVRDQIDHQRIVTENIRKDIEINHIFTEIKYSSPVFVKPLKDAITREGDKFTFECEVTGSPEPSIEWYKDGILIQNNPDYKTSFDKGLCRLVIEETFAADSARFSCRASNLVGNATTNATLSVRENIAEAQMIAPRIVRYLASGSAKEGSSFEFSCTVTGNPLPTVQWYKNDKCIDDSPDYVISYNNGEAKLRFEEVFLEDDAVYTCSASNPAGIEHCSASLIVEPLEPTEVPHFKIPLNNAMARVGQKVKLEALVGGIPRPEVYWLHNGKQYFPRDVKYEYGRVTLIIPQAYPNDAGVYVLTAKNLAGEAYSSCNVIVKGRLPNETSDSEMASDMEPTKPTVQLSLKDVSIVEGKPLRLDCIIVGQPEPEVIWYHNEKPIKESADLKLLFQGDKCSLIIQEAFADDAGNYKVVAINSAGEASSSCDVKVTPSTESETASVAGSESKTEVKKTETVTVEKKVEEVVVEDVGEDEEDGQEVVVEEVEEEEEEEEAEAEVVEDDSCLEFVKKFEDQSAEMGEMVKFEVVLKAKPKATVAWFFNGNEVKADNDNFVIASKGDEQYSLTIKKMSTATAGKVEVRAKNTLGVSSVVAFLGLSTSELDDMTDDETQSLTQDNSASASVTIEKKVVTTTTTQSEVKTTNGEPASQIPDIVDAAPKEMVLLETTVTGSPTHGHDSAPNSPAAGRKAYAPRFTTPLAGKIVDQGTNVSMEAVVDGHPTPDIIKVEKNGFNLAQNDRISIEAQNNHVVIGVKNVNHSDAGRYAVTASNVAGQATTTADLIVKKSIFPPVFGKRLQAQVMKKNEKIVMEVEVTGLPAPTVVWMKDEKPLNEVEISQHRLLVNGNCHTLIIERAQISDSGKYMVKATNAAGEAKSIADCAVLEPTPERMQEVVKTVVFERPDAFTTEFNKQPLSFESLRSESTNASDRHGLSESKIITEHRCTTEATMRLEHKPVYSDLPDRLTRTNVDVTDHSSSRVPMPTFNAAASGPPPHFGVATPFHPAAPTVQSKPSMFQPPSTFQPTPVFQAPSQVEFLNTNDMVDSEPMSVIDSNEKKKSSFEYFKKIDKVIQSGGGPPRENIFQKPETPREDRALTRGEAPQMCFVPGTDNETKTKPPPINERIKQLEEMPVNTKEPPHGGVPVFPPKAGTPKPSLEGLMMEKLWSPAATHPTGLSGSSHDLRAPSLVKQAAGGGRPKTPIDDIYLPPGTPPEMCFAPKDTQQCSHRQSIVETMEKIIEEKLIQSRPANVLPQSVPTVTPLTPTDLSNLAPSYKPPPPAIPSKLQTPYESDYESDRYKFSGSESDENSLRTLTAFQAPAKTNGYAADTEDKQESYSTSENKYHHEDKGYSVTSMTKNVSYNMSSTTGGAKPFASEPVHQQQQPPMAYKPVAAPSPIPAQRKTPAAEYSDYSSEIDERFRSVSRASENEIKGYRVVQPPTPVSKPAMNGHKSPAVVVTPSPMEFEPTPPTMGPSYAKPQFNNYQQQQSHQTKQFSQSQQTVFKPKPVAAKFLAAAAQQQQNFAPPPQPIPRDFKHQPPRGVAPQPGMYYNAVAGSPVHVPSMATETKNSMQMKESSESCQRMVNMQQTQRVMHFDNQQQNYNNNNMGHQYQQPMEQFPYSPTPSPRGSTPGYQRVPPPATPTKFVPGHFRGESNYSHIDNVRIAPLWTPNGHSGPMRYRHVDAPQGNRSSSLPRTYERVLSPMEFDRGPEMPTKIQVDVNTIRRDRANNIGHQNRTQSLNRNSSMRSHQQYYQTNAYDQGLPQTFPRDDMNLKVGSPPRYGGVGANWQSQAEHQGKSMSSSFMQKTQKFSENIKEDMHKYGSNGSASPMGYRVQRAPSEGDNRPQAYRDESRVSQYGTRCVDPNTGLVYFKYDFGYEFGILFPGEGHKFVASQWNKSQKSTLPTNHQQQFTKDTGRKSLYPLAGGRDLIIPVHHERSSVTPSPLNGGYYSDTEVGKYRGQSSFRSVTPNINTSPSPCAFTTNHNSKKRYSLPNTQAIDINIDRLHSGDSLNKLTSLPIAGQHGHPGDVAVNFSRDEYVPIAPIFITPLKDHAVAVGQTARFECIVQSHPTPSVTWSRNGYNLDSSNRYYVEYRNGVCRLTIPHAYPDDAGNYACTAANPLGVATSNANLEVNNHYKAVHVFK
ncbi:zormin isoform X2 [Haematobia irritans]|uniref:zormin isoform X2 n=1 Tax=Haematobia irritans TaxID=7368 RepID=UPI003F4FA440